MNDDAAIVAWSFSKIPDGMVVRHLVAASNNLSVHVAAATSICTSLAAGDSCQTCQSDLQWLVLCISVSVRGKVVTTYSRMSPP